MPRLLSAAALAALAAAAPSRTVINNTAPRLDNTGAIMDAHDLQIRALPGGGYVMFTVEYGLCVAPPRMGCDQQPDHCGFRNNHNVTTWTSPTLESGSWVAHGNAFEVAAREVGILYRPDAIFSAETQNWTLWYNLAGSAGNIYATAVSASPFGPFVDHRRTDAFVDEGGDFHVFEDPPTGDAYLIYTWMAAAPNDHKIRITRLDRGFRGSLAGYDVKDDYIFAEQFTEAPALFYRAASKTYYAVFGHCCCYCYQGARHTAAAPTRCGMRAPRL